MRILFVKFKWVFKFLLEEDLVEWFYVFLLVVVKNEEVVISKLVKNICILDYFINSYELLVIDDNSIDKIFLLLE